MEYQKYQATLEESGQQEAEKRIPLLGLKPWQCGAQQVRKHHRICADGSAGIPFTVGHSPGNVIGEWRLTAGGPPHGWQVSQ